MKTIHLIPFITGIFAVSVIAVLSCSKEEEAVVPKDPNNPYGGKLFSATLIIDSSLFFNDVPQTRTTTDYAGKIYWETTDTISINGVAYVSQSSGETTTTFVKAEDAPDPEPPYEAYYPYRWCNSDGSFSLPDKVEYNSKENNYTMPMFANDTTTKFKFKNICGILDLRLRTLANNPATVTKITVSDQWNSLSGKGRAIYDTEVIADPSAYFKLDDDTKKATVYMDCGRVTLGTATSFRHFLFPFCPNSKGYSDINIEICLDDGTSSTVCIQKTQLMVNEFRRNHMYALKTTVRNSTLVPDDDEVIFPIGNNKYAKFAKGNLAYDVTSGSWGFYNYQGSLAQAAINQNPVITDGYYNANLISQLTWGYNSSQSIDPTGAHTNNINVPSGNWDEKTQDWGAQIPDDYGWRTLTKNEWDYLLTKRKDAGQKWGYAKLKTSNGVFIYGLVILSEKSLGTTTFNPQQMNDFTNSAKWGDLNDKRGVLFLPMNGYRNGSGQMETSGDVGCYWTSTAASSTEAYALVFGIDLAPTFEVRSKGNGYNVRLGKTYREISEELHGSIDEWGVDQETDVIQ